MAGEVKNWEDFRAMLRGKSFIVGVDLLRSDDSLLEKYQTAGLVEDLTSDGFFLLKRNDGSTFAVPYDPSSIVKADKGEYTLKSNGQIIVDPDYKTTWEVKLKSAEDVAEFKARGFKR